MTDTRIRAPRAVDLLKSDHRQVRRLFDEYGKLAADAVESKRAVFDRLHQALTVHARIEEEIFYPAIGEAGTDEESAELLDDARDAHDQVRSALEDLVERGPQDEDFDAKMEALKEDVEAHVEEEERELFPRFEELEEDVRDDVAERLSERRAELAGE